MICHLRINSTGKAVFEVGAELEGAKGALASGPRIKGAANFEWHFIYKLKIKTFLLFNCFNFDSVNKLIYSYWSMIFIPNYIA